SLIVRFRAATPQLAYQSAQAIVDAFQERMASNLVDQAQVGINFYSSQINDSQAQVARSSSALRAYIDAAGGAGSTSMGADPTTGLTAAALDPRLADLMSQAAMSQAQLDKARANVESA